MSTSIKTSLHKDYFDQWDTLQRDVRKFVSEYNAIVLLQKECPDLIVKIQETCQSRLQKLRKQLEGISHSKGEELRGKFHYLFRQIEVDILEKAPSSTSETGKASRQFHIFLDKGEYDREILICALGLRIIHEKKKKEKINIEGKENPSFKLKLTSKGFKAVEKKDPSLFLIRSSAAEFYLRSSRAHFHLLQLKKAAEVLEKGVNIVKANPDKFACSPLLTEQKIFLENCLHQPNKAIDRLKTQLQEAIEGKNFSKGINLYWQILSIFQIHSLLEENLQFTIEAQRYARDHYDPFYQILFMLIYARSLGKLSRVEEALKVAQEALTLSLETISPKQKLVIQAFLLVAGLQQDQGDFSGALATSRKGLALADNHQSPFYDLTAQMYGINASLLIRMENPENAKIMALEGLEMAREHLQTNIVVAELSLTLGKAYFDLENFQDALLTAQEGVGYLENHFPTEHSHLSRFHYLLSCIYSKMRSIEPAVSSARAACVYHEQAKVEGSQFEDLFDSYLQLQLARALAAFGSPQALDVASEAYEALLAQQNRDEKLLQQYQTLIASITSK